MKGRGSERGKKGGGTGKEKEKREGGREGEEVLWGKK